MNIAVDIDDTLTDSFDYFIPFVAEYFHADETMLRSQNISYVNLPDEWKKDELNFGKAYYDRIVADTPFKPGAALNIRRLHDMGHRIIIITGRTSALYTDPYKTTMHELANGGIIYDKLICTMDKTEACLNENVSLLIDDLPSNCISAAHNGISVILFNSKANINVKTGFCRVLDWNEAFDAVISFEQKHRKNELK